MNSTRLVLSLTLTALASASVQAQQSDPRRRMDLSRFLVVGDSLSAGFMNGSLMTGQQEGGFTRIIATRAKVELPLPLIYEPGIPNVLTLVDPGPPPILEAAAGVSAGRIDPLLQPRNLAVPGHSVADALRTRPDFLFDDLTDLVLGLPGALTGTSRSQVEWAEALQPTAVFVWLGANDTLGAAVEADAAFVTPQADFEESYAEVLGRLDATGARLVVANIPDVTVIPYLSSAEEVAALTGLPLELIGPLLGLAPGDFVTPDAFEQVGAILGGFLPGLLTPDVVLDSAEVASIRAATVAFNAFIASQAAQHGAALVDLHGLLEELAVDGQVVGGMRLTVDFLGGIFSLDGIHPTFTGHAIVANEVIRVMNRRFAAGIPPVSLQRVASKDPLVLGRPGDVAGTVPCVLTRREARALRRLMRP